MEVRCETRLHSFIILHSLTDSSVIGYNGRKDGHFAQTKASCGNDNSIPTIGKSSTCIPLPPSLFSLF